MILQGDSATVLKDFNDNCIDSVITSPPYWGLRDYKTEGQLGLEPTFQEYIDKLVAIFDEVKRILKKGGTCWIVIGDTYGRGDRMHQVKQTFETNPDRHISMPPKTGFSKSLVQIPQRFAIAMLDHGWILRNDIIWYKPNCMPSSATDRFTVDYEHIFFFTKSQNYYFETQYEPMETSEKDYNNRRKYDFCYTEYQETKQTPISGGIGKQFSNPPNPLGRIKRTVWKIATKPFPEAHFAVFPEELIKTPILAGCPEGGIVLDPFAGSGTTLKAAHKLHRKWIGIEINHDYIQLAKKRLTPYIQQQRLERFMIT